jgi:branched-chain amino acid transport system substrate-binding protein
MKEANVEVTYFGGLHTEGGLIVRQSADAGLKSQFISGDGIVSDEFASIAGPAAEGVLNTFGPDPRLNPAAADVVKKFRDAGFEPEAYTLYSYAAIQVLAQAIAKAGSADDAQKVAEVMKSGGPWKTVMGDLSFDSKGDRTSLDYVMYKWQKGDDGKITYKML